MGSLLSSLRGLPELPQTPKVELLLVSDVDFLSPCCSCREKEGVLKCSGCRAVTYCGQECQDKGWNNHKDVCNEINQLLQQVNAAIEVLANEYGGVEGLLESKLVKDGRFRFRDHYVSSEDPSNFRINNNRPTKPQEYDKARWKLINAYARCGKEAFSKLAFRLAAENFLYMLRLCRNTIPYYGWYSFMRDFTWHKYCGWMVAGEMDQQALNFLDSIQKEFSRHSFHSFHRDFVNLMLDLSDQEDIEGLSVVSRVKENALSTIRTTRFKVHDFMLISLIKFKRIKALKGEEERWETFLEGTQARSGASSVVLKLSGMAPVLDKLKGFIVDKAIDARVDSLTHQVNDLLTEVNEENPKLIPGVLNRHVQMVDNPTLLEIDEEKEYYSHIHFHIIDFFRIYDDDIPDDDIPDDEREVHIARFAVSKYGHAWHTDNDYTRALRLFLETGNVMEKEEESTSPETGTAEEDTSPVSGTPEEDTADTSLQTKMEKENTIPEIGIAEKNCGTGKQDDKVVDLGAIWKMKDNLVKESHSNGIKVDEAVSDDRERDGENSMEEKEGLGLSEFCDNDNEFKAFGGKVTEKEEKGFKDDKDKTEESSY